MARRKMMAFKLHELSAVDRPAQVHAKMTIMKRDDTLDEFLLSDDMVQKWIDPADGMKSFAQVVQDNIKSEAYYEQMKDISPLLSALDTSLRSIAGERNLNMQQKRVAMQSQVNDFLAMLQQKWPEAAPSVVLAVSKGFMQRESTIPDQVRMIGLQAELSVLKAKLRRTRK